MTPITVYELNEYVRQRMAEDPILSRVYVEGEISGLKRHSSGHMYFTLKDDRAQINCVYFAGDQRRGFIPADGMKVIVGGYTSLYARDGRFQLYVKNIEEMGAGLLYLQFEQLRKALEAKGYFAQERKRPIPSFSRRIGVVTSPTGAVFSDICDVARRRFPQIQLVLAPVAVQGDDAPDSIVRGIQYLNAMRDIDVLIVGRGGGSAEDLWCFNDEKVVEAIVQSRIPVVSAVGHETDYTLADFAADLRAPTPSAAAELVTPRRDELEEKLALWSERAEKMLRISYETAESRFKKALRSSMLQRPEQIFQQHIQRLDFAEQLLDAHMKDTQNRYEYKISRCAARIEALSPLKTLARGYSVVTDQSAKVLRSAEQARQAGRINVMFADGAVCAEVDQDRQF